MSHPKGSTSSQKCEHYQEGMRLLVTLPYHFPRDRRDCEYLAQVVPVDLIDKVGSAASLSSSCRRSDVSKCND